MATKNLARSILEPGKEGSYKWEKKYSHRERRSAERTYLHKAKLFGADVDDFDIVDPIPQNMGYKVGQGDNLEPLKRYLYSNVGRPFDEVLSELHARHDTRTMEGWHLFGYQSAANHGHLWDYVHYCPRYPEICVDDHYYYGKDKLRTADESHQHYGRPEFFVPPNGILSVGEKVTPSWKRKRPYQKPTYDVTWSMRHDFMNTARGGKKVVRKVGNVHFWYIRVCCDTRDHSRYIPERKFPGGASIGGHWVWHISTYVQQRKLTGREVAVYKSLHSVDKDEVTWNEYHKHGGDVYHRSQYSRS